MLINARLISNCAQVCVRVMCKGKRVGGWGRADKYLRNVSRCHVLKVSIVLLRVTVKTV